MKFIVESVYWLLKNKKALLFASVILTLFFGIWGYVRHTDVNGARVIIKTFGLFAFALEDKPNIQLLIAEFFATVTIFLGVAILFFKDLTDRWMIRLLQKSPYTLLIGLGEQNSAFLDQLDAKKNAVIVMESDVDNPNIEYYQQKGFGVSVSKAEEGIEKLNLDRLKNCIISTGNDRRNIAIGQMLMHKLNDKHQKVYVRIENRDLNVLFKQNILKSQNNVDIITYSLYENMAKALFAKHGVLGLQYDIAQNNTAFSSVVVGDTPLAEEIIYQLSMLSILPNQNTFTLHLIAPDATAFYAKIQKRFSKIGDIPHIAFEVHDMAYDDIAFYTNTVWHNQNLTNIYIATPDDEQNLDIAINLQDTTYIDKSAEGTLQSKVHIAIYHDLGLAGNINGDKEVFTNFYTFANMKEASSYENLVDEKLDMIAKLINHEYQNEEKILVDTLDKEWMDISLYKRASNKAQALHIDTKLEALGVVKKASTKSLDILLKANDAVMQKVLPMTKDEDMFPKTFDTLISKLARAEHDRWNAFHYLNGWSHDKDIERDLREKHKKHPCLLPFSKFDTKDLRDTYKYDVQSVRNIAMYLAYAGYELMENSDV